MTADPARRGPVRYDIPGDYLYTEDAEGYRTAFAGHAHPPGTAASPQDVVKAEQHNTRLAEAE